MSQEVAIAPARTLAVASRNGIVVPRVIADAGDQAARRFLEFFAATIRNKNTRMAYYRAVGQFFAWCDRHRLGELADIEPLHVAAYIEGLHQEGLAGLSDRKPPGAKPRLSPEHQAELAALVRSGPDLAEHGVVRWRRIDLSKVIEARFGVHLAERSVGALLWRLGFRHLSVRPHNPAQDPVAIEAHKKTSQPWSRQSSPTTPAANRSSSGARVGQQGTLTYTWTDKGSRPPAPRDCRYRWAYIFGAVCPARGIGAGLVLPYADKQAMTLHLAAIGEAVTPGAHAVVIVDGAGWHKPGGRLTLPDNVSTLILPPYSPELNPQENIWQYLRQNYLSNRVFGTYEAIVDACCAAWMALMKQPDKITSIATRKWAKGVTA